MTLCIDKRGVLQNQVYLTSDRVELTFSMPLGEIVFDFYDKLKSVSRATRPSITSRTSTTRPSW